eukprot:TRINITY_DN1712_c0_g2_i1.p1 TRINITY_DN1712_c0_g2~~TRINITY_DN1712_c0_g2_i1.p1  ORF type:complete len:1237 (+),score=417.36 TRINITY_DN1712_c0_g2_i1:40-3750(+)
MQSKGKQASTQLFQKSLPDLVKGIRKHKKNEQEFIQKSIQEIKDELKHRDIHVKVIAVQKMTYLHMIGYNMEYGAFTIVEVMSSSEDFSHKRIGFLACAQCFHDKVEMVQMIPNLLRNALKSANQWEQGVALSCLSNICNPELAEILVSEVANLLSSQRPYIRKKCLLTLFKIFLQYPSALRPCFPRIKEKLDDPDPSVTAAAVNVICELARKNPKNYLGMAPVFFKLLSNITTNWTLIKIVKVFSALAPEEPRLPRKLAEPLIKIIDTTAAKSLLYEALITVASNTKSDSSLMKLTVEKLREFVQNPDQNLKYLGLKGLARVMENSPQLLLKSNDIIIECLGDEDLSIRMCALDLVGGLVSKKNLHSVIAKMQEQLTMRDDDEFRNTIVKYIVDICRQQNYTFVTNFEWYLRVLMDLTQSHIQKFEHGGLLEQELMTVVIRVKAVRAFGVKAMCSLLCNPMIYQKAENNKSTLAKVLKAAAYLASEYVKFVPNKQAVISSLMRRRTLPLPADIQTVIIQASLKIYAYVANPLEYLEEHSDSDKDGSDSEDDELPDDDTNLEDIATELLPDMKEDSETEEEVEVQGLSMFLSSCDVDVHEHAASVKALIELHQNLLKEDTAPALSAFFSDPLLPVREGAQATVDVSADLDTPIFDYIPEYSDDDSESTMSSSDGSESSDDWTAKKKKKSKTQIKQEEEADRKARELEKMNNPHYLPSSRLDPEAGVGLQQADDSELPPVEDLGSLGITEIEGSNMGTKGFTSKKTKKKSKHKIMLEEDAPEGYEEKLKKERKAAKEKKPNNPERAEIWNELDVDLNGPVKEALPTMKPYQRKEASDLIREEARRKKKEEKKNKKKKKDESSSEEQDDEPKKEKKSKKSKKKKAESDEEEDEEEVKTEKSEPQGVQIMSMVAECSRKKKKKGKPASVVLDVMVSIVNNTKGSLRSVSVKVKDDDVKVEAGDGFKSTKANTVNQTSDGHSIKIAKGETAEVALQVEVTDAAQVMGVVSFTSKDVPESHEVEVVKGMLDYLGGMKKANRELFFDVMGELNQKDSSTVKEIIQYDGDMKGVLSTLQEKCKLKVVEVLDDCAACMGTLLTPADKHEVCLLLKASADDSISAEIKTSGTYNDATSLLSSLLSLLGTPGDSHEGYERAASPMRFLNEHSPIDEKKEKKKKKEKESKKEGKKKDKQPPAPEEKKKKEKKEKKDKKSENEKKPKKKESVAEEKTEAVDSLGFLDM